MLRPRILALLPACFVLSANSQQADIEPLMLATGSGYFSAIGTLVPETGKHIDRARRDHPEIKVLVMQFVPGSDDDNDYMDAAWKLHRDGFTTVIPSDGLVASGGTDFFLAGKRRIIEPGACVGVHSWEDGGPPAYQATDLPRDHEDHQDFLSFFNAIGVSAEFYWFTISAAPADGMHWMSPAEINRFQMSSEPVALDDESPADRAARCNRRASGL